MVILAIATALFSMNAPGSQNNSGTLFNLSAEHGLALQKVGFGSLSWFGFSIYDASLWTNDGSFKDLNESLPIALHIIYKREIDNTALAKRTAEEWDQLNIFSPAQREAWKQRLTAIWPTVKPGDSITTLVTRDRKTYFYYNQKLIGVIQDISFGTALLSIWLDANTSEPALRRQLMGYAGRQS